MKNIIISTTNDLTTDQRVAKICDTLFSNNYNITLIGRKLKNSIPITRKYKTIRMRLFFNNGFLFYAEYNIRLFFKLLFLKKDILVANDLDTLLPNYLVSKLQSKTIIYDSHELFTEIPELVDRPRVKKIWESIERRIIPNLKNCYTVSDSIAEYYKNKYKTHFETIRNLPKTKKNTIGVFPFDTNGKTIILYQGAVNIGRGLELMLDTMKHLENHIFVVIGSGDIINDLKKSAVKLIADKKVYFLGKLTPPEMNALTPLADIGISLEEDLGLNYRYALPNKLFDYLHAEVPVLVSNLPEMKKIIDTYKFGEIIQNRNPKLLAKQIEEFDFRKHSEEIINAKNILNWENEEQKIISIYQNAK
ncbi:glycosyltransferase [Polaribacter gochangensis]|uniref:glycosyltransferase n=1 Tax=Polaribacter gochangensis TaxID=3252903 RepID=UPI003904A6CC